MKKAFDQTVRDLKREVNKKVLKVPVIEQKVLDATSNEPWGPHGSHLADIAQATRNFHEYQMIMSVLWKRVNDTGKNWRHVYKALSVLEYLVAHGSERVIDEIKEHAYQISTLSDFQYIDSSGRDQGSNVRKKSQSLVTLVNDKERIQEVRQKAFANRDKFRTGGMHKSSSYSGAVGGYGDHYDDNRSEGHYGSRDDERDRDWNYRDEDRYKRGLDSYTRDGDPYGRSEERYNRDGYKDDDYRRRGNDDNQFGPRNRSFDSERNRPGDEDDQYSSRSGGGRGDEYYQDERRLERKLSSQHNAPPTYEETVAEAQRHNNEKSDGGSVGGSVHKASTQGQLGSAVQSQNAAPASITTAPVSKEVSDFDEFDPRGSVAAGPTSTASAENDLLGSLMGPSSPSALAIIPVPVVTTTFGADALTDLGFGSTFVAVPPATSAVGQPSDDLFGDSPFKAMLSQEPVSSQSQSSAPTTAFSASITSAGLDPFQPSVSKVENISDFDFVESFQAITYTPTAAPPQENLPIPPTQLPPQLPPQQYLQPPQVQQPPPPYVQMQVPSQPYMQSSPQLPSQPQMQQQPQPYLQSHMPALSQPQPLPQLLYLQPQPETHMQIQPQQSGDVLGNLLPQSAPMVIPSSRTAGVADMTSKPQSQKEKFEPKSAVWADTLSRGLVNLNISGPKINPLADIGIDFDSINRMDKRKEKEKAASAAASSSGAMGKAMGAGSGIGRAGATGMAPPPNLMMGAGMGMGGGIGMGMGIGNGAGMGMGGYVAGMNPPMGMAMGMAPVTQPRPGAGLPPAGPGMNGYNPMMGMGGYAPQNPYGGYR